MDLQKNIFIAKKMMSQIIYNSARIEGCNVTFPQTQTILDGMAVSNVTVDDIQTVINLRDAYRFVLSKVSSLKVIDLDFIKAVNNEISRNESIAWGVLRTNFIGVSGTDYIPPIPQEDEVKEYLDNINNIADSKLRAMIYFISATKRQLFWDGNKRTSIVVSNAILIANGQGLLSIDEQNAEKYNNLLNELYNSTETGFNIDEPITNKFIDFLTIEIDRITRKFDIRISDRLERAKNKAEQINQTVTKEKQNNEKSL